MSEKEKKLINIKIALIGDAGVGKTSIAMRYANNEFKDDYSSTGGAAYSTKTIQTETQTIHLDIWDTAGQEKFRSVARSFYKDAVIVVLVYDITNQISFNNLKEVWLPEIKNNGEENIILGVVGNKNDQYENEDTVNEVEAKTYSDSINGIFKLVSAKTGDNINNLFNELLKEYFKRNNPEKVNDFISRRQSVKIKPKKEKHKKKCC